MVENVIDSKPINPNEETQLRRNKSLSQTKTTEIKRSINSSALNPCMFAPTGDIYSYFKRRPMMPSSSITFQYPLRYSAVQALSSAIPLGT